MKLLTDTNAEVELSELDEDLPAYEPVIQRPVGEDDEFKGMSLDIIGDKGGSLFEDEGGDEDIAGLFADLTEGNGGNSDLSGGSALDSIFDDDDDEPCRFLWRLPRKSESGLTARSPNPKPLTTERRNLRKTVFSARKYSDPRRTTNAIAASTRGYVIKV